MHTNFIQLPPDSTGKKILVGRSIILTVDDNSLLVKNDVIVSSVTSVSMVIQEVTSYGAVKIIYARLNSVSEETPLVIAVGETLRKDGVVKATIIAPAPYYEFINLTSVVSAHNPFHGQKIDEKGAASVRFAEGEPLLAAFGDLKVATGHTIGVYDFTTDSADDLFSDTTVGGGTITYLTNASTVSLGVTSTIGDFAGRMSDKYHFYWPGVGMVAIMTVALSDNGVTGCVRRWGLFDNNDGIYFELDNDQILKIALRSSVTGSVITTAVSRSLWNGDKLDGSGVSQYTIDLTKINLFWMDLQWLGGGRVRFGVIDDHGDRITCHTILNANKNAFPYMRAGSLPISFNIQNTSGHGATPSIRMTCCAVRNEGEISDYTFWRYQAPFPTVSVVGANIPLVAVKSKAQWEGKHNGTTAFPTLFSCLVESGTIKLDVYWDVMAFTGATWAVDNGSTVIADTAATAVTITTQVVMITFYLAAGSHIIDLSQHFETNDVAINSKANETEPLSIAFIASTISGSPAVTGAVNYRELR